MPSRSRTDHHARWGVEVLCADPPFHRGERRKTGGEKKTVVGGGLKEGGCGSFGKKEFM